METHEWEIRDAVSQQDWVNALEVMNAVYVGEGYTKPEEAARVFSRVNLEFQGNLMFIADSSGKTLGVIFLVNENSRLRQIARAGEAEFRLLAVSSAARGRGVGRRLVQECLLRARTKGMRGIVLSTQPSQHSAHKLYSGLGFVREPERDWQTPSGSPRWAYLLELV